MQLASDNSWAWRRLKHVSWRSRWIILCTLERRMAVSCKISGADQCLFGLSLLLTEHEVPHCYALNAAYRCVVAEQLYPSCVFSLADCRCFQVFSPSQEIHSTALVHHAALTMDIFNQNCIFSVKVSRFCLSFANTIR